MSKNKSFRRKGKKKTVKNASSKVPGPRKKNIKPGGLSMNLRGENDIVIKLITNKNSMKKGLEKIPIDMVNQFNDNIKIIKDYRKSTDKKPNTAQEKAKNVMLNLILEDDFDNFKLFIKGMEKTLSKKHPVVAKMVLSHFLNKPLLNDGSTSLHVISKSHMLTNRLDFIYYLYLKGANFKVVDNNKRTPLYNISEFLMIFLKVIHEMKDSPEENFLQHLPKDIPSINNGIFKVELNLAEVKIFHQLIQAIGLLIKFGCDTDLHGIMDKIKNVLSSTQRNGVQFNRELLLVAAAEYLRSPNAARVHAAAAEFEAKSKI